VGLELIDKLSEATGTTAPAPLSSLKTKSPRFNQCTAKENMPQVVLDFLK
jgi:hypothetical protein